jgi:hypothetical protein
MKPAKDKAGAAGDSLPAGKPKTMSRATRSKARAATSREKPSAARRAIEVDPFGVVREHVYSEQGDAWRLLPNLLSNAILAADRLPEEKASKDDRRNLVELLQAIADAVGGTACPSDLSRLFARIDKGMVASARGFQRDMATVRKTGGAPARILVGAPEREVVALLHEHAATALANGGGEAFADWVAAAFLKLHGSHVSLGTPKARFQADITRRCRMALARDDVDATALVRAALRGWGVDDERVKSLTKRLDW